MAPIIVPNAIRVSITGNYGTRTWANVIGGLVTGTPDPAALAEDILTSYFDNILPVLASSVQLGAASFVDLSDLDGLSGPVVGGPGLPANGGGGDNGAPPNVAYLVHLEVPGGRSTRNGRMYLPGVNEAEVTGTGIIDSDQVLGMNAAVDAFLADVLSAGNGEIGVIGKLSSGSYQIQGVVNANVDSRVATQRRRLRK